ncbi:hypothetical protein BKA70DRAFT_1505252 [Coprinopsis sp. MPI-PUGE-AT-0042]|nr:hypothetical protein BKA70DRAFT_1505252 [Coprinopsis sp. MPI-PUGE-AT-0042]
MMLVDVGARARSRATAPIWLSSQFAEQNVLASTLFDHSLIILSNATTFRPYQTSELRRLLQILNRDFHSGCEIRRNVYRPAAWRGLKGIATVDLYLRGPRRRRGRRYSCSANLRHGCCQSYAAAVATMSHSCGEDGEHGEGGWRGIAGKPSTEDTTSFIPKQKGPSTSFARNVSFLCASNTVSIALVQHPPSVHSRSSGSSPDGTLSANATKRLLVNLSDIFPRTEMSLTSSSSYRTFWPSRYRKAGCNLVSSLSIRSTSTVVEHVPVQDDDDRLHNPTLSALDPYSHARHTRSIANSILDGEWPTRYSSQLQKGRRPASAPGSPLKSYEGGGRWCRGARPRALRPASASDAVGASSPVVEPPTATRVRPQPSHPPQRSQCQATHFRQLPMTRRWRLSRWIRRRGGSGADGRAFVPEVVILKGGGRCRWGFASRGRSSLWMRWTTGRCQVRTSSTLPNFVDINLVVLLTSLLSAALTISRCVSRENSRCNDSNESATAKVTGAGSVEGEATGERGAVSIGAG